MSEPENFLSRWTRRKQEAAKETDSQVEPQASASEHPGEGDAPGASDDTDTIAGEPRAQAAEPSFDAGALPPIESITADTDIRAFLAPGVPAELARAALRRAWAADPKIRDFVGLADYAWDYHTPGSMPGFGPLEMTDELRQAVARIVGLSNEDAPAGTRRADAALPMPHKNTNESKGERVLPDGQDRGIVGSAQEPVANKILNPNAHDELAPCDKKTTAAQHEQEQSVSLQYIGRRGHGGALPE